jgi:hypothetical protein
MPTKTVLLRMVRTGALNAGGNSLHLILAVELHFFKFDFFQEVFRTEVGSFEDFLEFRFQLLVLLGQTPVVGV